MRGTVSKVLSGRSLTDPPVVLCVMSEHRSRYRDLVIGSRDIR